jgi:hypothetical protein
MAEAFLALDTMPAELFHWYLFVFSWFVWVFTRIEGITSDESESADERFLDAYDDRTLSGLYREPVLQRPEPAATSQFLAEHTDVS